MLLRRVEELAGGRPAVAWRFFSLTQVNASGEGRPEGWTVWDAPAGERVAGRLPFTAAAAARRQGRFDPLHARMLDARHRDGLDIDDPRVVAALAEAAGLDLDRFRADLGGRPALDALRKDHTEAVERHGVFGTPTFVTSKGRAAYVRIRPAPAGEEAAAVFDELCRLIEGRPYLLEVKRPAVRDRNLVQEVVAGTRRARVRASRPGRGRSQEERIGDP